MTYCLLTDEEISISHELPSYYPKATCETINKTVISSKITYELFDDNATNSDNPIGYSTEMEEPIILEEPYRTGYHFLGWYSDKNFKNKVTRITQGKGEITLYAKWEKHSYTTKKVLTEATCISSGEIQYSCKCGDSYTKVLTTTDGHSYTSKVTKATASKNGKKETVCSRCGKVNSRTTIYKIASVKLSKTEYVYNGKSREPSVTIKDSKGKTISADHYKVTYSNNKLVGKATVTIKFKSSSSKYSGTIKKTFKIVPKETSITKLTAVSKGFKVNIKKQSTQTSGYAIQYATNKNFKNAITVRISSNKVTGKKISGLKGKKKYYVRVRTYKTVNGKRIYSEWSKTKSVTTKK